MLALQVRVLRQKGGRSQADLARELGTSQNAIYRLENPEYGKHSISTLRKLAAFFDVGLVVRFAPVSEIMDWALSLEKNSIEIPPSTEDVILEAAAEGRSVLVNTQTSSGVYREYATQTGFAQGQFRAAKTGGVAKKPVDISMARVRFAASTDLNGSIAQNA